MGRRKIDKIFNNTHEENDYSGQNIKFTIESGYETLSDPESQIHYKILFEEIHNLIENSEFKVFNEIDEKGNAIKLNKVQINQVYNYVISNTARNHKIEVWSMLSEYFDIYPNKFYSSLSNVFKHDLVMELDRATNFLEKNKIKKLF